MGRPLRSLSPWTATLVVIVAALEVLYVQAASSALSSSRLCLLAGGVLDFYSQNEGTAKCLRNGLCPAGSVQAHSQCVAQTSDVQAREIGITMQLGCDHNCVTNEGVDTAADIWLAIARLLRVPLQETHAALLLMSSDLRERFPLEYFTLHAAGEEQLQSESGNAKDGMEKWDLFLAIRIHTARIGAAANELRQLVAGDIGNIARLSGAPHQNMHIFGIQERRTPGVVRGLDSLRPAYKLEGFGWNERPSVSYSSSGGDAREGAPPPPPPPGIPPPPPPPPAATPAPTPEPTPAPECGRGCRPFMIGDGWCDEECANAECSWDAGDCTTSPAVSGGGDSADQDPKLPGCGCQTKWLGNGICETFCNYDACNFDGGDCASSPAATNAPLVPAPAPAPQPTNAPPSCGCNDKWVGDGVCDAYCNTEGCGYDGGDCGRPWNAPPAPPTPPPPAPPPSVASMVPVPAPRPMPAPARASPTPPQPAPSPSSGTLRGTQPASGGTAIDQGTQVVNFELQSGQGQASDGKGDAWRIVASHEDGTTFYPDEKSQSEDEAGPFLTAAIVAIFFAATGLLAVTAVCILVRRTTKSTPSSSEHRRRITAPSAPKVFMESCTPNHPSETYQQQWERRHNGPSAIGKKTKVVAPARLARKGSKETINSQDSMSTTSTETPPSHGTPGSSRSSDNEVPSGKRREKEPKVHPEPEQPPPPPLPQWQRQGLGAAPQWQNRHSQPPEIDRAASKEAAQQEPTQRSPSMSSHKPSGATPEKSAPESAAPPAASANVRRASAPPAPRQEPKVEQKTEPKTEAAPTAGLRAAARADSQRGSGGTESSPSQSSPNPPRGRQKASSSGKYAGWTFGRNAPSSKAPAPSEPSARAKPQRSQSSPPPGAKSSWFGGSGPTAAEKATNKKANSLSADMMNQLDNARSKSVDDRRRVFKDLQRQLHPDKNIEQAEAAKLAFQKLMEQRDSFLAS